MAISETKICNLALIRLGASLITGIDAGGKVANYCNELYSATVDEVLRMHPWNSAINRAELSVLASTPEYGYSYQYTLPTSPYCLRVLSVENDYPFRVEGRKLLTDQETCKITYIKRIVNPTEFDSLLVKAISLRLASILAYPVVQSKTLGDQIMEEFKILLKEAKSTDAQEGTPEELDTSTWLNSRY